jgi:hypothetical protein
MKTHVKIIFNQKENIERTIRKIVHLSFFGLLFFLIVSFHICTQYEVNTICCVTPYVNANHNERENNMCIPKHGKFMTKNVPLKITTYMIKTQF